MTLRHSYFSNTFETEVHLTTEKWIHISVVGSNRLTEIYINGRKNISERALLPSLISGSFVLSASQSEGKFIFYHVINSMHI